MAQELNSKTLEDGGIHMELLDQFTDSTGRNITLVVDSNDNIHAIYNELRIGTFSYICTRTDWDSQPETCHTILDNANIKDGFQRAGIGTKIIEAGIKHFENVSYSKHLADGGAALLNKCIANGIIKFPSNKDDTE